MRVSTLRGVFDRARLAAIPSLALASGSLLACGATVSVDPAFDSGRSDSATGDTAADIGVAPDTGTRVDAPSCSVSPRPEPTPPCGFVLAVSGDPRGCGIEVTAGAVQNPSVCAALCGPAAGGSCYYRVETAQLECGSGCEGRRPEGLPCAPIDARGEAIGRWFARSAYLEAASVDAFRILRGELRHHRAPARLLRGCSRAARDEVRHARATSALARRHGVRPPTPTVGRRGARTLEAIAVENAVEGCVRETFGALIASIQADEARDPLIRAAMKRIAVDETRHAALSWALDAWIMTKLSPAARDRVISARESAVVHLRGELAAARRDAITAELGVPNNRRALAMFDVIARAIWLR